MKKIKTILFMLTLLTVGLQAQHMPPNESPGQNIPEWSPHLLAVFY